ncbi:hypothetical protein TNCT_455931 [Trichonephila clavata]|uniref:Uncharacterized protein n=1 Tax=Trichonephila clavata TaxID=2740835 RepID=A0A8X6LVR6_TRICU|nr:hypothetical protein TNCT_455931 [Trichonephila clavata]
MRGEISTATKIKIFDKMHPPKENRWLVRTLISHLRNNAMHSFLLYVGKRPSSRTALYSEFTRTNFLRIHSSNDNPVCSNGAKQWRKVS